MTDNSNMTLNTTQQTNTQPEGNGTAGKMFTQDEVNAIVQERLARQRTKSAEEADLTARENDLKAREAAFSAKCAGYERYVQEKKEEAFSALLEEAGILKKYIPEIVTDSMKGRAFFESLEFDEDCNINDRKAQIEKAKTEFKGKIAHITVTGAREINPLTGVNTGFRADLKNAFGLKD